MVIMTISKNVWKIAALLLVLSLISFAMISGTFARYTSTFAGEDTALVAKWEITGTGDGFEIDNEALTLDLFEHASTNVATTTGAFIIAPGVEDSFQVVFQNDSDVNAKVDFTIALASGSVNVPIVYTFEDASTCTADGLKAKLDTIFETVPIGEDVTETIGWEWPYTGNDAGDTLLGTGSAISYNDTGDRTYYGLTITATATQLEPTE